MQEVYESPLSKRYASRGMARLFSDKTKFTTWRRLWVALAQSQQELGLGITNAQIDEMCRFVDDIDFAAVAAYEKDVRHDVMAHVLAYGDKCKAAKPIIHLGATSSYVGDNTDVCIMRQGIALVRALLLAAISALCDFADKYKDLSVLAYTHFQSAQPTTLGKRAALWLNDLVMDLHALDFAAAQLKFLGCKGATGTAASFLALFNGDDDKVMALERLIAAKMGFTPDEIVPVSGQTYSRKIDFIILAALSGIAQSVHKFTNDIRLMCHTKEVDEPHESGQIGSSAMAYKRNPQRSERAASIARHVISLAQNPAATASAQWFERTLDDSANRRIAIPEAFLGTDAVLNLYINIISGLNVYPKVIANRLAQELPFLTTENLLMRCVAMGGDRQTLHERIRVHSMAALKRVREDALPNDLPERIAADPHFAISLTELRDFMAGENFTGRAAKQTEEYVKEVRAMLEQNRDFIGQGSEIVV